MKKMLLGMMLTVTFVSQVQGATVTEKAGRSEAVVNRETQRNAERAARVVETNPQRQAISSTITTVRALRSKGLIEQALERDFAAKMVKDASFKARAEQALASNNKEALTLMKLELVNARSADPMGTINHQADYVIARESAVGLTAAVKQSKSWKGTAATSKETLDVFTSEYVAARARNENEFVAMETAARVTEQRTGKKIDWKKIKELCKA